jgi:hypothetical protein
VRLTWVTASPWAYPLLEAVHIAGVALLLGSLVVFELRVWGRAPGLALGALARLALPVTVAGFALAAASGLAMFAGQPAELLGNRAFVWKMGLLALAGANAAWFHGRGSLARPDALARAQTLVSTGLWLAIIMAGRWIAYV